VVRGLGRPRACQAIRVVALLTCLSGAAACREDERITVGDLTFVGVEQVDEGRLRATLQTKERGWLPIGRKPAFRPNVFAEDVARIEAFYSDRGFPDARVTSVDVRLNAEKDTARITVHVKEGEPIRVASVQYLGFDVLPPRRRARLERLSAVTEGSLRDRGAVVATIDAAVNQLKEFGYPYAKVQVVERETEAARRVGLTFQAEPGRAAEFGAVEIQGNHSVSDDVIRRQLAFEPGDPYRLSLVQESQQRFSTMELFDFAYVEPRAGDEQPASVPMRVSVVEGKHRRFTGALGYGSEEKVRARGTWRHVNFFGAARSAGVEAKWSSIDRGVRMDFRQPYVFGPNLSFSATAQAWDQSEPVYRTTRYGGRGTLTWRRERRDPVRRRSAATSFSATFIDEYNDYRVTDEALADPSLASQLIALGLDPVTGEGQGTVVGLRVEGRRDTVFNPLDPQRGYLVALALERAGRVLAGDFTYTEVTGEARAYWRIPGRTVLAGRVRAGSIDAPEPTDASVPFFKRYFLGGSTSLRGWGRFEVAPLTADGQPYGGLSFLEASGEVRLPIKGSISAVAFVDAGSVGAQPWDFRSGDLLIDVGPGIRYDSPIGPVRFDVGYQLTPIEGLLVEGMPETRRWRMHLSIGQAF
jgi:outer membrane protein assembly complex protein YaeT